jgi:hypothetical protein
MSFFGIPMTKSGGDSFIEGINTSNDMMAKLLAGKQAQQRIQQEALANEQLNNYRMGQLNLEKDMNPLRLDLLKAQIEAQKALSNQRSSGMMNSTAQQKDINSLIAQIKKDNPGLNDYQAMNIANSYLTGNIQEGIPDPSGIAQSYVNQINKRGTTSQLINQTINSKQADAEVEILSKYASEWSEPYGDQFFGYSPKQITDSFSSNQKDQENLGKLIASNALQFEITQVRNRLAAGQSGITNTLELKKDAMQGIKPFFPYLSETARKTANDYLNKALKEGLNARLKIGIDASSATSKKRMEDENFKSPKTYNELRNLKDPGEEGYKEKQVNNKESGKIEDVIEIDGQKLYFFNNKWHKMVGK